MHASYCQNCKDSLDVSSKPPCDVASSYKLLSYYRSNSRTSLSQSAIKSLSVTPGSGKARQTGCISQSRLSNMVSEVRIAARLSGQ